MSGHPDEELVIRAQAGEEEAFNELYQRYYKKVYMQALRLCNNEADAQDVTMSTFEIVYRFIPRLRDPKMFSLWLSRITKTECIGLFRKNKDVYFEDDLFQAVSTTIQKRENKSVLNNYHAQSDKEQLNYLLTRLKPKQAEAIELMYFSQLSIAEIAKQLDIPEGTVKTRLLIGRRRLAKLIKAYEKEEHIKLDFHANTIVPSVATFAIGSDFLKKSLSSKLKIAVISCSTVVLAYVGITEVYPKYKEAQQANATVPPIAATLNNVQSAQSKEFAKVVIGYDVYYTAETAYYGLQSWAKVDELASKSLEECEKMKPLYQELQKTKSRYWDLLQTSGWSNSFEDRLLK